MRLITHPDRTVVKFSATELQSVGLPPRPAYVSYRSGLLDDHSTWLDKQILLRTRHRQAYRAG